MFERPTEYPEHSCMRGHTLDPKNGLDMREGMSLYAWAYQKPQVGYV